MNQAIKFYITIFLFNGILFSQSIPYFDSEKAFNFILKQCDMGPRFPGSDGHVKFSKYLKKIQKKRVLLINLVV